MALCVHSLERTADATPALSERESCEIIRFYLYQMAQDDKTHQPVSTNGRKSEDKPLLVNSLPEGSHVQTDS